MSHHVITTNPLHLSDDVTTKNFYLNWNLVPHTFWLKLILPKIPCVTTKWLFKKFRTYYENKFEQKVTCLSKKRLKEKMNSRGYFRLSHEPSLTLNLNLHLHLHSFHSGDYNSSLTPTQWSVLSRNAQNFFFCFFLWSML